MKRALLAVLLFLAVPALGDEDPPFPEGGSFQSFADLRFRLEMPVGYDATKEYSLIVALHGAGSSDREFATWFEPLVPDDFIVCAPKSTSAAWSPSDIEKVKQIVEHLLKKLSIGEGRLHGVGFSNGGAYLGSVVFDPKLPFKTACFMGSGWTGGKLPRRAKEMSVIALVGEKDPARGAAESTVKRLEKKVRRTELHIQPEIAHEIPRELMPYYYHWLKRMEGRFTPGECPLFDWYHNSFSAKDEMKEKGRGGLFYFYSEDDAENADARRLEHETFFDERVRFYAGQLTAALLEMQLEPELAKELGIAKTPAVAVLDADGKAVAVLQGKIGADALADALKKVAPEKKLPKREKR